MTAVDQSKIRNIAIIAHVDHGKTTLVDELFKQSGMFRDNEKVDERLMDSNDLERERGITISSKNGAFEYKDNLVNIIDTPGHADFGGQVERVLQMADAALLLVDAQEGPMPQTYFVLKKALAREMPIIVVINKIDKPAARCDWVLDQVFDLFVKLNAPDEILDFPVIYASAKDGYAIREIDETSNNMECLFDSIIEHVPSPAGDAEASLQMLVSTIDHSSFLGRLGIGKITSGSLKQNDQIAVSRRDGSLINIRASKIYKFYGNQKVEAESASVGDIIAVAGCDDLSIGETFTSKEKPMPLPPIAIDPPTLSMNFVPNDSPFAGQEGEFVTSRHLEERLKREILVDVAISINELTEETGYKVSGRGELHLSILIEKMRREGYEFQVTRPQVIMREINGKKQEPYEELTVDVDEAYAGKVIEKLGMRKGEMMDMFTENSMTRLLFKVPTRGLLGYRSEFMTDTKGTGDMSFIFSEYGDHKGDIPNRKNGALIASETHPAVGFALQKLQDRGVMFVSPGTPTYEGMIVGENNREGDLVVNVARSKQLTNVRAAGSDENISLTPPRIMSLEDCIEFINDDELLELTPKSIRLRKRFLKESDRKRFGRKN